jgi:hypothetical protein
VADPLWSVLIATLNRRQARFLDLLSVLLPQAETAGCVEVVACPNDGDLLPRHETQAFIGRVRDALVHAAAGKYVSFIDDDDMVADDYVATLVPMLGLDPDTAAFTSIYYESGQWQAPSYASLRYPCYGGQDGFYRDLGHIQPIRASIARQASFMAGWPEDHSWLEQIRPLVRTEEHTGRVLYHYRHDWADSVQDSTWPEGDHPAPVPVDSPCFRYITLGV